MSGRVLVVDDSKVIRQLIRVNLELEGFEVVTAADGLQCLEIVNQVRPDVITLDVVMPRLDGLRTAARLRADPGTRHVRLAIISAGYRYEVDEGEPVAVDAYLGKPFEPTELVRLVRRLMHNGPTGTAGATGASPLAGPAGTAGDVPVTSTPCWPGS
jgi:CheY-like chemotaxis protein